jgi:hypothetical protein
MQPPDLLPADLHILKVGEVPHFDRADHLALDVSDECFIAFTATTASLSL